MHNAINGDLQAHTKNKKSAQTIDDFFTVRSHVVNQAIGIDIKEIN
jgi:hypothetical protein